MRTQPVTVHQYIIQTEDPEFSLTAAAHWNEESRLLLEKVTRLLLLGLQSPLQIPETVILDIGLEGPGAWWKHGRTEASDPRLTTALSREKLLGKSDAQVQCLCFLNLLNSTCSGRHWPSSSFFHRYLRQPIYSQTFSKSPLWR